MNAICSSQSQDVQRPVTTIKGRENYQNASDRWGGREDRRTDEGAGQIGSPSFPYL